MGVLSSGIASFARTVRPELSAIYGDGRYRFKPIPPSLERRYVSKALAQNPEAEEEMENLQVWTVLDRRGRPLGIVSVAFVVTDSVAAQPEVFENFIRGAEKSSSIDLRSQEVDGTQAAYGEWPRTRVLVVAHAPDLFIALYGPNRGSRRDLYSVARYLLRGSPLTSE